MGKTPDRNPGVRIEEGIIMRDKGVVATAPGEVRYVGGRWSFLDASGEYDPRSGSGISEVQHEGLNTLSHELAENYYFEVTRAAGRVTEVVWWEDSSKQKRVRDSTVTRVGGRVSQVVTRQYDDLGVVLVGQTLTETITRASGRVSSTQAVVT